MHKANIDYKIKTATSIEINSHLMECDDSFSPSLSETVNIEAYSKKIHEFAVTFEAWCNNELIGLIAAYFNDKTSNAAFITNVSVINSFKGKGIASVLLENCIDFAKTKQMKKVVLEVSIENKKAIRLYEKYNFKERRIMGDSKKITLENILYI